MSHAHMRLDMMYTEVTIHKCCCFCYIHLHLFKMCHLCKKTNKQNKQTNKGFKETNESVHAKCNKVN